MKPFNVKPTETPNTLQKMLKQTPKVNAFIEVNNLLANGEIDTLRIEQIEDISTRYGFDVLDKFKTSFLDLYESFLAYSLSNLDEIDLTISTGGKLVSLLRLDKASVDNIWLKVAKKAYEAAYLEAISDSRITDSEYKSLDELGEKLRIPESDSQEISKKTRTEALQKYFDRIISDGRISPEEEIDFRQMADSFKTHIEMDDKTRKLFEKMKVLWNIENEELPILTPDINLSKKEPCFYTSEADWYEYRVASSRYNYSGPTFRVKIMKGVYYRVGQLNVNKQSQEVLKKIGHGKAYITAKRILFYGENRNFNIPLGKILDIESYSNGIDVKKDTGKNVFIGIGSDSYLFAAILSRVIKDYFS